MQGKSLSDHSDNFQCHCKKSAVIYKSFGLVVNKLFLHQTNKQINLPKPNPKSKQNLTFLSAE